MRQGCLPKFIPWGLMSVLSTWDELEDGLLGITVRGDRCFRVEKTDIKDDNLCVAEVSYLNEDDDSMPDSYQGFSGLLKEIANAMSFPLPKNRIVMRMPIGCSERLAEILPFEITAKQALLEMDNALHRLDYMQVLLEKINARETNQS